MGMFLKVAYDVLFEHGAPLSAREIVDLARQRKLLPTQGATPAQTMKSKLSTDILKKKDESLFMRSEKGTFALREWSERLKEFTADRYQKALFDEDIVVFSRDKLPFFIDRPGITNRAPQPKEYIPLLRKMRRQIAEEDQSVIQLVSVFVVRKANRILTYKRTKRLPESRLHDFYSLAFGGHLNPDDISSLFSLFIPEQGRLWLERELLEELKLKKGAVKELKYCGLLYDDSREVSKQHLGITYEVIVNTTDFVIGERGFLMDPKFETVDQIQARRGKFENWSTLLLDHLGGDWR